MLTFLVFEASDSNDSISPNMTEFFGIKSLQAMVVEVNDSHYIIVTMTVSCQK